MGEVGLIAYSRKVSHTIGARGRLHLAHRHRLVQKLGLPKAPVTEAGAVHDRLADRPWDEAPIAAQLLLRPHKGRPAEAWG